VSNGVTANWRSGKDGYGYSNNGVQITSGASGAYGNSPISYQNIVNVTVNYCTNASSGAGTIYAYGVSTISASAKSGTLIGSRAVSTTGGTTGRDLSFDYSGASLDSYVQIYVETTTNSIYIIGATITYGANDTPVNPTADATAWADNFLESTSQGCSAQSSSALQTVWNDLATSYDALSDAAKMVIYSATPSASGTAIENAVARYINIVKKYGLNAFIDEINVTGSALSSIVPSTTVGLLVVFGLVSLIGSIFAIVLSSKPKKKLKR